MILWRLFPRPPGASTSAGRAALWFPRELQGSGRHDNPEHYGCLYVSESPVSAVAEALAPFRGTGALSPAMFFRAGQPLMLAGLELKHSRRLVDLDEPRVLSSVGLRPSEVATNVRAVTQAYAARVFAEQPDALGLSWWSTLEASFTNLTLYDRAAASLRLLDLEPLTLEHTATRAAADLLGLMRPRDV